MFKDLITKQNISEISVKVADYLKSKKLTKREIDSASLMIEEISLQIFEKAGVDSIRVNISNLLGTYDIHFRYGGEEYNFVSELNDFEDDDVALKILRNYRKQLNYTRLNKLNIITFNIRESSQKRVYTTLICMVLGILVGIVIKSVCSTEVCAFLDENIFGLVKTLFLNAVKLLIAPIIFFALTSSIGGVTDLSDFGKTAAKAIVIYVCTSTASVIVALLLGNLFSLGLDTIPELFNAVKDTTSSGLDITFSGFLTSIIPTNLVDPISSNDLLQIIFVSVFFGITISVLGIKAKAVLDFAEIGNMFFSKMIVMLMKVLPAVIFCSMASMIITMGEASLMVLLRVLMAFILGIVIMTLVYIAMFKVMTKLPIKPFAVKLISYFLIPFSLGSSSAAIPATIQYCEEKMGIDYKLPAMLIPFGSIFSMDGTCLYIATSTLIFATISGVELTISSIAVLVVMTVLLAIAAPPVTGAGLICLSAVFVALGIPIEGIAMIMGMDGLLSMLRAGSNSTIDVLVVSVIGKRQGLMNVDKYMKL